MGSFENGPAIPRAGPEPQDVESVFAGIRPLIRSDATQKTAALARDHKLDVERSGLITITGGKWTTYRHMAEMCVDKVIDIAALTKQPCVTKKMRLHGFHATAQEFGDLQRYGSDAQAVRGIALSDEHLQARLHPELPYIAAEVVWSARTRWP